MHLNTSAAYCCWYSIQPVNCSPFLVTKTSNAQTFYLQQQVLKKIAVLYFIVHFILFFATVLYQLYCKGELCSELNNLSKLAVFLYAHFHKQNNFFPLLHYTVFSVTDKMTVILWTAVTAHLIFPCWSVEHCVAAHVVYVFPCSLNLTRVISCFLFS